MTHSRMLFFTIVMFVCTVVILFPRVAAQENIPRIATDRPIYPIWKNGGMVSVTATQLASNKSYYLWLQRPTSSASNQIGRQFRSGTDLSPFQLTISSTDPAGTYLLSLSTSNSTDTRSAVAHFGVFGTDRNSYERTQEIMIAGGGLTPNSTVSINLRAANYTVPGFPLRTGSGTKGDFNYAFRIPSNVSIGDFTVTATGLTFDGGQTTDVSTRVQIGKAALRFTADYPRSPERTMLVRINARVTYPSGIALTPKELPEKVNMTISQGSLARRFDMNFNATTGSWFGLYSISHNASLGDYLVVLSAQDVYGNGGKSIDFHLNVVRARLKFEVPQPSRAGSLKPVDISIYVKYPNESYLTNLAGRVNASYTVNNSSSRIVLPMMFNATERKWHMQFITPDQGLAFGITLTFSFDARDFYGNTGSASEAYTLTVGATTQAVILTGVLGAIVPVGLLAWAIIAISRRRRKHKP